MVFALSITDPIIGRKCRDELMEVYTLLFGTLWVVYCAPCIISFPFTHSVSYIVFEGEVQESRNLQPWSFPYIQSVRPLAVEAGEPTNITLKGFNLTLPDTRYFGQCALEDGICKSAGYSHLSPSFNFTFIFRKALCRLLGFDFIGM